MIRLAPMRVLLPVGLTLLSACGAAETSNLQGNGAAAPPAGEPDNRIECRPAGAAEFARACTMESADTPRGRVLTIRKADGGFRRVLVGSDGRIGAADGAEAANVTPRGSAGAEVEIGGDRFRLPARPR